MSKKEKQAKVEKKEKPSKAAAPKPGAAPMPPAKGHGGSAFFGPKSVPPPHTQNHPRRTFSANRRGR